ncbi:MAG: energy-coupling factor transporter ATPase [Saccharofermentanales bacterium]
MEAIFEREIEKIETGVLLKDISFTYDLGLPQETKALSNINLEVRAGQHVAVLGHNGSGKSTLAHLINALLLPQEGNIVIFGREPSDNEAIWEIRCRSGMVFQNPDNQIIGTTLEEDVAFGPENLGLPQSELRRRVDFALEQVGLTELAQRPPHTLSGGQKQKLAIAGILAMEPSCLILDEATAMLDPASRNDFMDLVLRLRAERELTIINITHNMEEVLLADYIYVVHNGKIALHGTASDIFDQAELIRSMGLDVPVHIEIAGEIARLTDQPLQAAEAFSLVDAIKAVNCRLSDPPQARSGLTKNGEAGQTFSPSTNDDFPERKTLVRVRGLSYTYNPDLEQSVKALSDLSLDIYEGEFLGIAGHSGSGKSTFIQHLNGLIRPEPGVVEVMGLDVSVKKNIRKVREHLGLLFQYPEQQLFEETVAADIAFGPKQMGLSPAEIELRVREAAELTGLEPALLDRSPFDLSGGQMRRVAIAGILAMKPNILVLDEPTAGLDPAGRDELLNYIQRLQEKGQTIVMISHDMDQLAGLCDRILVLKDGVKYLLGTPAEVFEAEEAIVSAGLAMPRTKIFLEQLSKIDPSIRTDIFTPKEAARELYCHYQAGGGA